MLNVAHGTLALQYECKHLMGAYAMFTPIEHLSYSTSIQMVVSTCRLFLSTLILSTYILCESFNISILHQCIRRHCLCCMHFYCSWRQPVSEISLPPLPTQHSRSSSRKGQGQGYRGWWWSFYGVLAYYLDCLHCHSWSSCMCNVLFYFFCVFFVHNYICFLNLKSDGAATGNLASTNIVFSNSQIYRYLWCSWTRS